MQAVVAIWRAEREGYYMLSSGGKSYFMPPDHLKGKGGPFPDYAVSVDAMRGALALLPEELQHIFCARLVEVIRHYKAVGEGVHEWDMINASARQLCESLIKTVGLVFPPKEPAKA